MESRPPLLEIRVHAEDHEHPGPAGLRGHFMHERVPVSQSVGGLFQTELFSMKHRRDRFLTLDLFNKTNSSWGRAGSEIRYFFFSCY